jgi:hypothetical protein
MYKQFGARVVVFMGYKRDDGKLKYSANCWNHEIGNGTNIKKTNHWDNGITMDSWRAYLTESMNTPAVEDTAPANKAMELEQNEYGDPLLPDIGKPDGKTGKEQLLWHRAVLRAMVTAAYRKFTTPSHLTPFLILQKGPLQERHRRKCLGAFYGPIQLHSFTPNIFQTTFGMIFRY